MRLKEIFFLCFSFLLIACSDVYNKNEETIRVLIVSREADRDIKLKNFKVIKHTEASHSIKVFVEITDLSNKNLFDTVNLVTTGDGFVVP